MKEQEIFIEALHKDAGPSRAAYLDQACGDDAGLRKSVEELLADHDSAGSYFLDHPVGVCATVDLPATSDHVGTQIGPYKIREQIGEGGMGIVFVAEQTEPVRRKVALKIIKPGMDSREVVARFEAERQALAMMDHPNIARVFDGGATDNGQPYFVMELVQGQPINAYCDEHRLGTRERLELFQKVCRAVHHAHQKGVIHRDLKPSNVMVPEIDGAAVPKVIDFGVAKAVSHKLTEQTLYTQFSQLVGTPLYMSPEQAGLGVVDVDVRSDVYSLGVLLYELLTGSTPFDSETLKQADFDEMRRIIREDEPLRPSAKVSTLQAQALSTVAEQRGSDARRLSESFQGELDWLVMKALDKDRNRRYESASALAADLSRYLNDEAVEACPPTLAYRFKKSVRRNRVAVTTAAAVFVALLLGIVGTGWQAWQAVQERDAKQAALDESRKQEVAAERSAAESRALVAFFVDDLMGSMDPEEALGRQVTVAEVVQGAERKLESDLQDQPLLEAAIRRALGKVHDSLGNYKLAERQLVRAREIQQRLLGTDAETLRTMHELASVIGNQGRSVEARQLSQRTLELKQRVLGPDHPETLKELHQLGVIYKNEGNYVNAEATLAKVLQSMERVLGEDAEETIVVQYLLGTVECWRGHLDRGKKRLQSAVDKSRTCLGEDHPTTLRIRDGFANVLIELFGELETARSILDTTISSRTRIYGAVHPMTLRSRHHLLGLLKLQGQIDEALARCESLQRTLEQELGTTHPRTQRAEIQFAKLLARRGKCQRSIEIMERIVESARRADGAETPRALAAMESLADVLASCNMGEDSLVIRRQILETRRRIEGPEHAITLEAERELIRGLLRFDEPGEARSMLEKTLVVHERVFGAEHFWTLDVRRALGHACHETGDTARSESLLRSTFDAQRRIYGDDNPDTMATAVELAFFLAKRDEFAEARELLEAGTAAASKSLGHDYGGLQLARHLLAVCHQNLGDHQAASTLFREAVESYSRTSGKESSDTLGVRRLLAKSLRQLGEFAEAREILEETVAAQRRIHGPDHDSTLKSMHDLGLVYKDLELYDKSRALFNEVIDAGQRKRGADDPERLVSMRALSGTFMAEGRKREAYELDQQVGVLRYGAARWGQAAYTFGEALKKADDAVSRATSGFYLAMARWQEGQQEAARNSYDEAANAFREANPDTALEDLQVKAAVMLQIGEEYAAPENQLETITTESE